MGNCEDTCLFNIRIKSTVVSALHVVILQLVVHLQHDPTRVNNSVHCVGRESLPSERDSNVLFSIRPSGRYIGCFSFIFTLGEWRVLSSF